MDVEAARHYLLGKPEAIEDYPFGPDVAVMKVRGKMFATLSVTAGEGRMNLKCDPDQALALRDLFSAVLPGYHMNKKHWNTVCLDGSIPSGELQRMIDHSYALVVKGLPKAVREARRAAMYRSELMQRAALYRRVNFDRARARQRLVDNVGWDFEQAGAKRAPTKRDIDSVIASAFGK